MSYTIRDLQGYGEMVALRQLQQAIWGLADPNIGLYPPLLTSAAKNGGIVLGAFAEDSGEMIGFLFSFLGREPGGPFKVCSQTMGVRHDWRGQGVAEALKRTQRARTLAQDLPLITWTYDPLEAPNAHLNLHKLRAISRRYWRDVYGTNFGALNQGLPTDRLVMEWWVKGERLDQPPEIDWELVEAAPAVFETRGSGANLQVIVANLNLVGPALRIEIPADIHPVKAANLELALDWRMKVRKAFESYFERGYVATNFVSTVDRSGNRRNQYVLQKLDPALRNSIGLE
jgi:predicted GNAT superfamily acetyltransferase